MLNFNGSTVPTIGVEIELQILNPSTFDLTPQAEHVISLCRQQGVSRVKAEIHQSMIEIDSEISLDVKECRSFLEHRMIRLNEIAESLELKIGVTGTHPFQKWQDRLISNDSRYIYLHEKFQWLVQRMNIYALHVHIGVPTGDRVFAISNAMVRYLPHLLALSANSPFWQGKDTGMQSSRVNIMESFPFAGLPPIINSWKEFEYYYDTLHKTGIIGSLKDLYWYIRPNVSFGTIEFRICDATSTLSENMAIVALIQTLTASINEQLDAGGLHDPWTQEHLWIAPENQWIAARDGLEGMIITDLQGTRRKISDEIL
ncbi:MAG TPA: YbdK family carboxylate-amine ligase, partial [Rhabdochlamydiaceae bacterium]